MSKAEQGRKFDLGEAIVRGSLGTVLGVSGVVMFGGSTYDMFANTLPAIEDHEEELDRKYPLVDIEEIEEAQGKTAAFAETSINLAVQGRGSEIAQVAVETSIQDDLQKISQQQISTEARTLESLPDNIRNRKIIDYSAWLTGFVSSLAGQVRVMGWWFDRSDRKKKENSIAEAKA